MPVRPRFPFVTMLGALVLVAFATPGLAQDRPIIGDIEGAEFRPFPIAVPDLRAGPGADALRPTGVLITKTIRDDLDLSAVFRVLDPRSFIDTDGVVISTVKFDDWLNVGADGLVKGTLKADGADMAIEIHAYEVASQREGFTKSYKTTKENARDTAHLIADDLYRHYTREPGVFRTKIAAVRKGGGSKHVIVLDFDGKRDRQLTTDGSLNLLPSWTSDGSAILYTSYRYDNPDLFEISSVGSKSRRVSAQPGLNTGGKASPDGKKIALTLSKDGNSEIYLLDRNGTMLSRLTNSWGIDTSPEWSPDGTRIAFVSSRAGNPHIYIMNADGSGQERLTFQGTYNQTPSFSPRGTHIAFTARDERNRFDIFLYDIEKKEISRITQDQGNNEDPTFSPNGRLVAFVSDRSGSRQVWLTNLDGTRQRMITNGGEWSSPAWGPLPR
jgi:TolB protein